jgi:glycosyltransferase involved in cell wall biosynthesis
MQKTILIITDNLPEQINGVVTTYKNIEALAVLDGYRILYLDPRQFLHFSCPGYPEVKLSLPWQIGKKIEEMDPDYIHIATEGPIGLFARLYLDKRGYRYNTAYHTKFPEFLKDIYHVPLSWTYWYVRWFHKHSGKVLTTTQTMVNDLKHHGFEGNLISWTRGVDRSIFGDDQRSDTVAGRPILLSVGRISKEKGLDDFCRLDYPGATKIVVGDGPYLENLKERYPEVIFTGARRGRDLAKYYANSDVFVFTSRADTFGIVIIESLACGTPVAAYPVPGPQDIIENGVTGHMSEDLKDSIEKCLTINRQTVKVNSEQWTWQNCWVIFKNNLMEII